MQDIPPITPEQATWWQRLVMRFEHLMQGEQQGWWGTDEQRRKKVYNHRRDMLLEALRLRRWLDGHDYEEDPPE